MNRSLLAAFASALLVACGGEIAPTEEPAPAPATDLAAPLPTPASSADAGACLPHLVGHCDVGEGYFYCLETWSSDPAAGEPETCAGSHGVWTAGKACDLAGQIGGCAQWTGSCSSAIDYHYRTPNEPNVDSAAVAAACASEGGAFVVPFGG